MRMISLFGFILRAVCARTGLRFRRFRNDGQAVKERPRCLGIAARRRTFTEG